MKFIKIFLIAALALLPNIALAQATAGDFNLNVGEDIMSAQRIFQVIVLLTVFSLAPSILVMVTSFTRIIIVFSFLRSALGLQTTPPNTVLMSLALFLTTFIMAPTIEDAYKSGVQPYIDGEIAEKVAFTRTTEPFKEFMMSQVNPTDLQLFLGMMPKMDDEDGLTLSFEKKEELEDVPLRALIPAFIISEIRRAFEIGFLIFLPFLIIDLTVASILMSMGMMMLPPVMISLPFKVIFFVLVDGWHLLAGSLVESFKT